MSRDPASEFQELEDEAYRLLFEQTFTDALALERMRRPDRNETHVEMAIEAAHTRRHEEALRGQLEFGDWVAAVARDIGRSGRPIAVLAGISAVFAFVVLVVLVKAMPGLPPPRTVLKGISVLAGLVAFGVGSYPVYLWERKRALSESSGS